MFYLVATVPQFRIQSRNTFETRTQFERKNILLEIKAGYVRNKSRVRQKVLYHHKIRLSFPPKKKQTKQQQKKTFNDLSKHLGMMKMYLPIKFQKYFQ